MAQIDSVPNALHERSWLVENYKFEGSIQEFRVFFKERSTSHSVFDTGKSCTFFLKGKAQFPLVSNITLCDSNSVFYVKLREIFIYLAVNIPGTGRNCAFS
jgi:hypothetical protein